LKSPFKMTIVATTELRIVTKSSRRSGGGEIEFRLVRVVHLLAAIVLAIVTILIAAMLLRPAIDREHIRSRQLPHDRGQKLANVELAAAALQG
jgi:nucleoside permease NupC